MIDGVATADARPRDRLAPLLGALERAIGVGVVAVTPFRQGVDSFVDAVVLADGRRAVLRTAKVERLQTTYDGLVDSGEVLAREVAAAELLADAGVPVPRLLAWSRAPVGSDERSWMLAELVEHTPVASLSPAAQRQLGAIARRIHGIVPVGTRRRALPPEAEWEQWVVDRIVRRIDAARAYVQLPKGRAIRQRLERAIAGRGAHARRLLHLDLRPPNLAVVDDRIVAVFDFGNAICGDPYLELARIRQCDLLTPAFQQGYGLTDEEIAAHADVLGAYSLDTTALLVVVSREEFDDPVLHQEMTRRTVSLVADLLA